MHSLRYDVVSEPTAARSLWEHFVTPATIDDEWDFRYTYSSLLSFELHFIVGYDGDLPVALLPLQRNNGSGFLPSHYQPAGPFLEIFGGDATDENVWLLKPGYESCLEEMLGQVKEPAFLAPLNFPYEYKGEAIPFFMNKYYLDLPYASSDEYVAAVWKKDSAKKVLQQMRNLYRDNTIEIEYNCAEDLELLFEFNIQRFKDDSSFLMPYRRQLFLELYRKFPSRMLTVRINGVKKAVNFGILYGDRYIGMNSGVDPEINNLGKLVSMLTIEHLISLGIKTWDAGKGSGGWKEDFGFRAVPQYMLELP